MRWGWRVFCWGLVCLSWTNAGAAETRLVLAGGGTRQTNYSAVDTLVKWMADRPGPLLRIRWASQDFPTQPPPTPGNSPYPTSMVIREAPSRFTMDKEREAFLRDLNDASAVHFGGGDQAFIMETVLKHDLLGALRKKFRDGFPFSGTSAGTAIMSRLMFTGQGDETIISANAPQLTPGLGFLPDNLIIDQHFLAKKRLNRMLSAVSNPGIFQGLGIDEDGAVTVEDGRWITVLKNEKSLMVRKARRAGRFTVDILEPGQRYDLRSTRR